jgi:hypothetical protein
VRGSAEENPADLPGRHRAARCVRGSVLLGAPEPHGAGTLRSAGDVVEAADGAEPDASELSGEVATLVEVCLRGRSPLRAWREGHLRLDGRRGAWLAAGAAFVLSVPVAIYGGRSTTRASARNATVGGAVALVAVTGALARRGA